MLASWRLKGIGSILAITLVFLLSAKAETVTVDFNELGANNSGVNYFGPSYQSQGFFFDPDPAGLYFYGNGYSGNPGSGHLFHGSWSGETTITYNGGENFSLLSTDLAEEVSGLSVNLTLIGTLAGGGTVTTNLTLDGAPNSQTFTLNSGFTNLISLTISHPAGYILDKFVFNIGTEPPVLTGEVTIDFNALIPGQEMSATYTANGIQFESISSLTVEDTSTPSLAGNGVIMIAAEDQIPFGFKSLDLIALDEAVDLTMSLYFENEDMISLSFSLGSGEMFHFADEYLNVASIDIYGSANFAVDNVTLAVPEPGTTALIVLGAAAMLIGGRRLRA